jgi:hypothetical protein
MLDMKPSIPGRQITYFGLLDDTTTQNVHGKLTDGMIILKNFEVRGGNRSWLILSYHRLFLDEVRQITKKKKKKLSVCWTLNCSLKSGRPEKQES